MERVYLPLVLWSLCYSLPGDRAISICLAHEAPGVWFACSNPISLLVHRADSTKNIVQACDGGASAKGAHVPGDNTEEQQRRLVAILAFHIMGVFKTYLVIPGKSTVLPSASAK